MSKESWQPVQIIPASFLKEIFKIIDELRGFVNTITGL